jgi:hypothetical protein
MSGVQEEARERAARELARRVADVAAVADPLEFARRFVRDMTASGAWRYVPPSPGWKPGAPNPEATERGAAMAREALTRKDDHHA